MKYVVAVHGGHVTDISITCDYAAVLKCFHEIPDTNVQGFVSFDVHNMTEMLKILLFGRDDINMNETEYGFLEGEVFHGSTQTTRGELKKKFLGCLEARAPLLGKDDTLTIIIHAHGHKNGCAVIGDNLMTKLDIYTALKNLTQDTKLYIINTACFAGHYWEGLPGMLPETVQEMPSPEEGKHYTYRTLSEYQSNMYEYTVAFISETKRYSDGSIRRDTRRFAEEYALVDCVQEQEKTKPSTDSEKRTLWGLPISEWIPAKYPIQAAAQVVAKEEEPATTEKSQEAGNPQDLAYTYGEDVIRHALATKLRELKALGVLGPSESTWADCTRLVLTTNQSQELFDKAVKTFSYQEMMIERASVAAIVLINSNDIPVSSNHDDYDLDLLSEEQLEIHYKLDADSRILNSQLLPIEDTLGGVYSVHIDWLACVLDDASKKSRDMDIPACIDAIGRVFDFGDNWAFIKPCEESLKDTETAELVPVP